MAQVEPFVASAVAADISAMLAEGDFLAQVRAGIDASAIIVLYATAPLPPSYSSGYFQAAPGDAFRFSAGPSCPPTWVRVAPATLADLPGLTVPIALARIEA